MRTYRQVSGEGFSFSLFFFLVNKFNLQIQKQNKSPTLRYTNCVYTYVCGIVLPSSSSSINLPLEYPLSLPIHKYIYTRARSHSEIETRLSVPIFFLAALLLLLLIILLGFVFRIMQAVLSTNITIQFGFLFSLVEHLLIYNKVLEA